MISFLPGILGLVIALADIRVDDSREWWLPSGSAWTTRRHWRAFFVILLAFIPVLILNGIVFAADGRELRLDMARLPRSPRGPRRPRKAAGKSSGGSTASKKIDKMIAELE